MLLKYREKILKKSNHSLKNLEEKLIFNAKKQIIFDVCSGKKQPSEQSHVQNRH